MHPSVNAPQNGEADEYQDRRKHTLKQAQSSHEKIHEGGYEKVGDFQGAFEYIDKLKELDPRNKFVDENYESYKNNAENGGGFVSFFKSIFGKRMG